MFIDQNRSSLETKSWKFRREIQDAPFRIIVESTDPDLLVSQAPRYKGVRSTISSDGNPNLTVEFGVKLEGSCEHNSDAFVVSVQQKHGPKRIFSQSFDIDTYRKSQRPAKKAKRSPRSSIVTDQQLQEALQKASSNDINKRVCVLFFLAIVYFFLTLHCVWILQIFFISLCVN